MKKEYMKPMVTVVELPYHDQLLTGSLTSVDSSLLEEDDLLIDTTTPIDDSFWGR